jgi:predicted lipoprotein with Yx(FWY)xxD motif
LAAATLTAAALVLPGVALADASAPAPAATATGTVLKTRTISGMTVLTNAKGFTLYSFAPDTPTRLKCYGTCAAYWSPAAGRASAGAALPGKTGTSKRNNGSLQLTYNGHPL